MLTHNQHSYTVRVQWTGNRGNGTSDYAAYDRAYEVSATGKPVMPGSSDVAFRGDASRYNPEDLLVTALSACHMLWYLHLCADAKIVVMDYTDDAHGTMVQTPSGGHFTEVVLRPSVTIRQGGDAVLAEQLHERAHRHCFIASSVNFPVRCEPSIRAR